MEFESKILNYEVNDDFQQALDLVINQHRNIFITGSGGVGKSTFYEVLSFLLEKNKVNHVAIAPTGVAAVRIGGQTIHRFFGFPIGPLNDGLSAHCNNDDAKKKLIRAMDVLIIDEVSMVRSDLFTAIDNILQHVREVSFPFGGVQIVLIGDLFQLSPIVKDKEEKKFLDDVYGGPYFFTTDSFKSGGFAFKEFSKCYRQKDQKFKDHLNKIRLGKMENDTIDFFKQCIEPYHEFKDRVGQDFVHLVSKNDTRDKINKQKLDELPGSIDTFKCYLDGKFNPKDSMLEEVLTLKRGALVMCLRNSSVEGEYQNGTIGQYIEKNYVEDENGNDNLCLSVKVGNRIIYLRRAKEENIEHKYNEETKVIERVVVGSITQFPITLAWARTIHKSQSSTYEKVYVDLQQGGFFPAGSVYTALSRATDHEYLGITSEVKHRHTIVDPLVLEFYQSKF